MSLCGPDYRHDQHRRPEPIDTWLSKSRARKLAGFSGVSAIGQRWWRVELHEYDEIVGIGRGPTADEATANALNDLFAREHAGHVENDECDRIFETQRRETEWA
jgi:hypothetical protein